MSEPQKTSHWSSLAETLGAKVPSEQPAPSVEPASVSPATPATLPPRRSVAAEKPKPAPRKSNWGEVASFLGLTPPPEPKVEPTPPPAPVERISNRPSQPERAAERPVERQPERPTERPRPERSERSERPPRREPAREAPRREDSPRSVEPKVREWNAPPDEDSSDVMDELTLGEDDSYLDEIELELVETDDEGSPRAEGDPRPAGESEEGERRPRRRRRRGRRRRRPEGDEARAPGAEPREPRSADHDSGETSDAGDEPLADGAEPTRDRASGDREGRPRRRKRRRGGSRSGRERQPPRRPAPDESARDEEAAFISETGGGDELDADFGTDDEDRGIPRSTARVSDRPSRAPISRDEDDLPDEEDEHDEDGELSTGKKHKIPSWQETIGLIVDSNLANRGKSSGPPQRGGRGRGRGRGGR